MGLDFFSNLAMLLPSLASQYSFFSVYLFEEINNFYFRSRYTTFIPISCHTPKVLKYLLCCHDVKVLAVASGITHMHSIRGFLSILSIQKLCLFKLIPIEMIEFIKVSFNLA